MDERELVRAAAAGEREAVAALVRAYQARRRALVALSTPSRDDVQDIVQEAFIAAFRGLGGFDHEREFGPGLRTLCRNRMVKFQRGRSGRRGRQLSLVDAALGERAEP